MSHGRGNEKKHRQECLRRNILLVLAYEGTSYRGWQFQPGEPTIQGVLQEKISIMTGEQVVLIGSGRTDAGVHALAQVANFRTSSRIPMDGFLRGLNSLLPDDIVVREIREVPDGFHSRYCARSKVYRYVVHNDDVPDPFWRRFAWTIRGDLDVEAMNEAARALLGQRNFAAFQAAGCSASHPVRTVMMARWRRIGRNNSLFEIEADGFLRHMVRNIVGTLVEVGRQKLDSGHVERILTGKNRQEAGITAPARGLFLKGVRYIA
ncbi:MAG: tRNA pseudouridine(38-40) synthase TruA [Deltaproteobacteria bacterium]|nr:tRNA pseudouridine(38-40) synthase TruA [Deltaproteobacteria bacterium]MBW2309191.1 tRNA pseudouridine(38-40) synthase TruA [Deltaproteobacteria bacterium]